MIRWFSTLCVLLCLVTAGCNSTVKELGPSDGSDTPQVSEDEIKKSMEESLKHMPDAAKKQYEQFNKGGGGTDVNK